MAKKPKKADYPIVVHVSSAGKFTYEVEGQPNVDATQLVVDTNKTVSWELRHGRKPEPFQVEFAVFNPLASRVNVIRSKGGPTKPPVGVGIEMGYQGNLIFKYTVSTKNGWWDDPDIVPVPSDGVGGPKRDRVKKLSRILTGAAGSIVSLSVEEDPTTGLRFIQFDPPDPEQFKPGLVSWQWATGTSKEADDFTVSFTNATASPFFPDSVKSQSQQVLLTLSNPNIDSSTCTCTVTTNAEGLTGSCKLTIKK